MRCLVATFTFVTTQNNVEPIYIHQNKACTTSIPIFIYQNNNNNNKKKVNKASNKRSCIFFLLFHRFIHHSVALPFVFLLLRFHHSSYKLQKVQYFFSSSQQISMISQNDANSILLLYPRVLFWISLFCFVFASHPCCCCCCHHRRPALPISPLTNPLAQCSSFHFIRCHRCRTQNERTE